MHESYIPDHSEHSFGGKKANKIYKIFPGQQGFFGRPFFDRFWCLQANRGIHIKKCDCRYVLISSETESLCVFPGFPWVP